MRSDVEPDDLSAVLRDELRAYDPDLPVTGFLTMEELVGQAIGPHGSPWADGDLCRAGCSAGSD